MSFFLSIISYIYLRAVFIFQLKLRKIYGKTFRKQKKNGNKKKTQATAFIENYDFSFILILYLLVV